MTLTCPRWRATCVVALVALLLGACSLPATGGDDGPSGEELVEALRDGGYVIYLRHTDTTAPGVDDLESLGDCDAQRELSDEGRQDAVEIGEAFDALAIPVDRVLASPFCRVVETAELAFGATETSEALLSLATMERVSEAERDRIAAAGAELIATAPEEGANRVLVGQFSNLAPIAGVGLEEGGTAVFRPDGAGGFDLIAELPPQGWQDLAAHGD